MRSYNGFSNYATWRVNLEICNDRIERLLDDIAEGDQDKFDNVGDLVRYLEYEAQEAVSGYGSVEEGVALDYARAFLSQVNWYEIAENHADGIIAEDDNDQEDEE